jgi:NADH:ubiquinone oxidoreductase subunit H
LGGWGVPGVSPETIEAGGLITSASLIVMLAGLGVFVGSIVVGGLIGKPELISIGLLLPVPVMIALGYVFGAWQLTSLLIFVAKVTSLVFVIIWIRWTLPRFRVDQMMNLCWKYLIPISFVCFIASTAWVWAVERAPVAREAMGWIMFAVFGVGLFAVFLGKVLRNLRTTRLLNVEKQIDFNLFY